MSSPKLVTEVPQEFVDKINTICDFVEKMKSRIEEPNKKWFKIKEAHQYLGVSRSTLTQTLKDTIIPKRKGKNVVYDRADLDAFWDSHEKQN